MDATTAEFQPQVDDTPWHFYSVAMFAFVWSVFCVVRFVTFELGMLDAAWMAKLQLAPFAGLPAAFTASWAVCTWGAAAGAMLLLIRSSWAVQAFTVSILGLIATSFHQFALTANPVGIYDTPFNLAVWVIALVALLYTLRAQARGLLH